MEKFDITEKTEISRLAKRGVYDKETIFAILDEAIFITLAYVRDGIPFQIPTAHCRIDDYIYIHGSVGGGYMRELSEKKSQVCITATLIDGLVLARSAFHHSANYRSAVIFGHAEKVENQDELYQSLESFTNKIQPGRWDDVRKPTTGEWKATMVIKFKIEEASAKIRTGDPKDDEEDYDLPVWAGVIPLEIKRLIPVADPALKEGIEIPDYLK